MTSRLALALSLQAVAPMTNPLYSTTVRAPQVLLPLLWPFTLSWCTWVLARHQSSRPTWRQARGTAYLRPSRSCARQVDRAGSQPLRRPHAAVCGAAFLRTSSARPTTALPTPLGHASALCGNGQSKGSRSWACTSGCADSIGRAVIARGRDTYGAQGRQRTSLKREAHERAFV